MVKLYLPKIKKLKVKNSLEFRQEFENSGIPRNSRWPWCRAAERSYFCTLPIKIIHLRITITIHLYYIAFALETNKKIFVMLIEVLAPWRSGNGFGHFNKLTYGTLSPLSTGIGDHLWRIYHPSIFRASQAHAAWPSLLGRCNEYWFRPPLGNKNSFV